MKSSRIRTARIGLLVFLFQLSSLLNCNNVLAFCSFHNKNMINNNRLKTNNIVFTQSSSDSDEATIISDIDDNESNSSLLSRREILWYYPVGGILAYQWGKVFSRTVGPGKLIYPTDHERRVETTISKALVEAAASVSVANTNTDTNTLRVLEVGVGSDCRLSRRGLYNPAIQEVFNSNNNNINRIEITGIDLQLPALNAIKDARAKLSKNIETSDHVDIGNNNNNNIAFKVMRANIEALSDSFGESSSLPFHSVLCCLTLCSVDDQVKALEQLKRILDPNGGTFGYVEHVAVNDNELPEYQFLNYQQQLLDPLQQKIADNCHLHRYTESNINNVFQVNDSSSSAMILQEERFLVKDMWPVSCQCCGVIQMKL